MTVDPPDAIVLAVAVSLGVRVADIRGRSRLAHIVRARHECWWRLRRQGWSLPAIGREFGVDHTSVLYALRKFRVRVAVSFSGSEITAEAKETMRQMATEAEGT